ncbi:MAG: lipid-binding SYLF domain-containing protein [Thermodesulfovibrionales bacterium]
MKKAAILITVLITALSFLPMQARASAIEEENKVLDSLEAFEQVMEIPEQGIPPALLNNAEGIAIIPNVIKAAFILGGRYGTGVVMLREEKNEWSNPLFISITGGSIGWQIGAQSTDIILVFKSRRGVENIVNGKFTLGADASIAAGPVGRHAEAGTDIQLKAEIYSYSRSKGLFAGISLEGASLQVDYDSLESFYGRGVTPREVFSDKDIMVPDVAKRPKKAVGKYTAQ